MVCATYIAAICIVVTFFRYVVYRVFYEPCRLTSEYKNTTFYVLHVDYDKKGQIVELINLKEYRPGDEKLFGTLFRLPKTMPELEEEKNYTLIENAVTKEISFEEIV